MIDDFIQRKLAEIDDLAELKVSLVALSVLESKLSEIASVTERELMAHPVIRDGLSFPSITLKPALQRAVARGTLLCASLGEGSEPRYFANTVTARHAIEAAQIPALDSHAQLETDTQRVLRAASREIERLELIEIYAPQDVDQELIDEWLACGYTQEEILDAIRAALHHPRPKGRPLRTLKDCVKTLTTHPPAVPSEYYNTIVAKQVQPNEEIVNLRERLGRQPTGHEYNVVRAAVGMFGLRAVLDGLKRVTHDPGADIDALIPLLVEQEEAQLALLHDKAQSNVQLRELVQLYESTLGLPATSHIADEIRMLISDVGDIAIWRGAFQFAASQNKRNWPYVKKLLLNPSPSIFEPSPANEVARFVFDEYRRRVNRVLDASVATEMNLLAQQITDVAAWSRAFDAAASANALNWNYIKSVLIAPNDLKVEPINEVAATVFEYYRRRIGRLDGFVARQLNEYVEKVDDLSLWQSALDAAASAGALNWNYVRKTLQRKLKYGSKPTQKRVARRNQKGVRRRQIKYSEAERAALQERARSVLEGDSD